MASPLVYSKALKKSGFVAIKQIIEINGTKMRLEEN